MMNTDWKLEKHTLVCTELQFHDRNFMVILKFHAERLNLSQNDGTCHTAYFMTLKFHADNKLDSELKDSS